MLTVPKGVSQTPTVLVAFESASVGDVRRVMSLDLRDRGIPLIVVEDATLVLSEILSNALRHARPLPSGRVRVRWSWTCHGVELEVTDGGAATRPRASVAAMSATGGRGLGIVSDLAREWGVSEDGGRTTVWAVVAPRDGPRRTGSPAGRG